MMKPLEPAPMVSAVLSFDFDGTLHDPSSDPPVPDELFETLRRLREDHAIVWGINTGRSIGQTVEGMVESRFPFLPDWVVAREHEIFFPNAFARWVPDNAWNPLAAREIARLFKDAKRVLKKIRREIEEHTGAQWLELTHEPAGLVAQTETEMEWIVAKITELAAGFPKLSWQRNSIYLRFGHRDFQKGSSLTEIARRYSLGTPRCFAIGDSHNDFEMLSEEGCGMSACPGNAVPEIRAVVIARGGYVCTHSHGAGVVEALKHFFP